ncbi:glycoside hydrolase family 15 protein [Pseudokineococcus lusitanus]|uniref:GH15 family glucan-1,4-alpha-glucosidase n=1 Tax=Pseudokineococcus lusitanus TaxID=763993 RepID=A0A3N1HKB3_9ACTN|nr:glycoside hydrolase family 15 protein [Pseudokineococcus lusitanus]ROP42772.1 GH15 family glucan-1,4-alpha-glucosidase [Pseudokineococcus lusitanus]
MQQARDVQDGNGSGTEDGEGRRPVHPCPVEDHGVVGDLRTVMLVTREGEVDFGCVPDFDGPAVFARLLDDDAGSFAVRPTAWDTTHQYYLPSSAVLATRFSSARGCLEVLDLMVPVEALPEGEKPGRPLLVRLVRVLDGEQDVVVDCRPRPDWGRVEPVTTAVDGVGARFDVPDGAPLVLRSSVPLEVDGAAATARVHLRRGEQLALLLHLGEPEDDNAASAVADAQRLLDRTHEWWRAWVRRSTYTGRWREVVHRSAITLKLLTYAPTGAVVAAGTTSLPEEPGGERNWDYRYAWLRDAAWTTFALMTLGFTDETDAFLGWLEERMTEADRDEGLLPVYTVRGERPPEEVTLDHLAGFAGSRPVRTGNAAAAQRQLDSYGELLDSIYLYNKVRPISWDMWSRVVEALEWLVEHGADADAGLWESRGEPRRNTYSQVMVWVAFERALRISRQRGLPAPRGRWEACADAAYRRVQEEGLDERTGGYRVSADSDTLDASLLMLPLVKFAGPTDPRYAATLAALEEQLVVDCLVRRYPTDGADGLDGDEGFFVACSFWYAEALARAGRVDEAEEAFEKTLRFSNHLGLFAEEVSATGHQAGNVPQALSHLALISAAVHLDRVLG